MNNSHHHNNLQHVPVLLEAVLALLQPKVGESYLDLTAGYGGHARAIIERTMAPERVTLVDRDRTALDSLKDLQNQGTELIHGDFASIAELLVEQGKTFDIILADLGVSSPHVDNSERGFSFMRDGPLDMRMDQSQGLSAEQYLLTVSEEDLISVLRQFGEEPHAKKIAAAIKAGLPIHTTAELARIVETTIRRPRGKTHPATRTFQAIRMAINDEIQQLSRMLAVVESLLNPGGRLAIISFHSLEDRLVKTYMREHSGNRYDATYIDLTPRPILGTTEMLSNPRSRSAVLRAVQRS